MKTPLGTEVDLGPGHTVLDGVPALRERGTASPSFGPMSTVATVAHLSQLLLSNKLLYFILRLAHSPQRWTDFDDLHVM